MVAVPDEYVNEYSEEVYDLERTQPARSVASDIA
jgi:hypothetical protein